MPQWLNSFLELNSILQSLLGMGAVAIAGAAVRGIKKLSKSVRSRLSVLDELLENQQAMKDDQQKIIDRIDNLEQQGIARQRASEASLHDRIYAKYEKVLSRDPAFITMKEYNNLIKLHDAYSAIGGNGTGDKMFERICDLPIRQDDDDSLEGKEY